MNFIGFVTLIERLLELDHQRSRQEI